MSTFYQAYEAQLAHAPLSGAQGQAWLKAHGSMKDNIADRLRAVVKARFPTLAPSDALALLGAERGIDRGQSETDASYAARVADAWSVWPFAGTAYGVLRALSVAGYSAVLPQVLGVAYSLNAAGSLVVTTLGGTGWFVSSPSLWSQFTVLFPAPLPSAWLAGGLTSVFHGGTGAPAVTASGVPTSDVRIVAWITTGGVAGSGAQFKYSTDGGATASTAAALSSGAFVVPGTGVTLTFAAGTYVLNDVYSVAPTFSVPADNSAESLRIKNVVNKWKPAHATVSRYIIHTSGNLYGWPASNKYGLPPTGGTAGGAPIYYGGSTATYWTA